MVFFCKSKKSFFSPPLNQPLPLVEPPPGALASAIHHTSTFRCTPLVRLLVALPSASTPILSQLPLVPRPPPLDVPLLVTAIGVVCNSPLPCITPLLFGWLSHIPTHQPLVLRPSCLVGCCISQRLSLSPQCITISVVLAEHIRCQRGSPLLLPSLHVSVASTGSPLPFPLPQIVVCCQGVAPRREQVRVDDVHVLETPLELGQKASCVSQL